MKKSLLIAWVSGLCAVAGPCFAVEFTNANFHTTPHPRPLALTESTVVQDSFAFEEDKTLYVDKAVVGGVRIWRFDFDQAFWWVTDKGIIWGTGTTTVGPVASDDEEAYLVYATL